MYRALIAWRCGGALTALLLADGTSRIVDMRKSLLGLLKRDRSRHRSSSASRESSRPPGEEDRRESQAPGLAPESGPEPEQEPVAAPPTIEVVSDNVSEDVWSRAFEALSKREPELVQAYGLHMVARHDDPDEATTDAARQSLLSNPESVKKAVQALQDEREGKQWRFTVKGRSHKTKDQVEKLVKLLSFADGIVKQAASAQPYAALAWSAVSVFLPLVSASFSKETAMVQGFTTIADLQLYWKNCEDVYLKSTYSQQYQSLNEPLCNLYSYMLEYQVRAICHLSRTQLSRAWDKLSAQDDWQSKESNILKLSEKCNTHIRPLEKKEIRQASEEKLHQMQGFIHQAGADIVDAIKDENQNKREREYMQNLKKGAGNYLEGMEFNKDPVKGTCEWFYQDEDFSSWLTSEDSGVFWVTAGPGCGKSVLARSLIKNGHLKSTTTMVSIGLDTRIEQRQDTICYFFFKDDSLQRTSVTIALCAILHQLFAQDPTGDLIKHALNGPHGSTDPTGLDFYELWDVLVVASESSTQGQVICVLDALDECKAYDREKLMTQLDRFYEDERSSPINLKFLVTSRPYDDIELSFKPLLQRTEYFRFDADERYQEISHDIGLVIEARIDSFASDFSEFDRQRIIEALKSRGTNTYLWLTLTLELMQRHPSRYSRQRDVEALMAGVPTKVSDAYEKTLNRSESEEMTSALLQIMLAARRPLTLDEANYALTLATAEIEIKTHAELDEECWKGDFKSVVKNFCGLLVSVYDGKLSFIHSTAREFLLKKFESGPGTAAAGRWGGRFADPAALHSVLARCCMQYLLFPDFVTHRLLRVDNEDSEYGLFSYAAQHWVEHFQELDEASQSTHLPKARQLCSTSSTLLQAWRSPYFKRCDDMQSRTLHFPASGLVITSYVGVQPVVKDLVENAGADVNELRPGELTALYAAVARNNESIEAYLISMGAELDARADSTVGTPLDIAVSTQPHYGNIKLLLAKGASPLMNRTYGISFRQFPDGREHYVSCTLLTLAAMLPDKDIFYMMLASLVDIGSPEAILRAVEDQRIVNSGDVCRAMILDCLDDERLGGEEVLTENLLPVLLSVPDLGRRALRLLKAQNRQGLLISTAMLHKTINMTDIDEMLAEFLAGTECANITQDVLELVAQNYGRGALRAFIQSSPKDSCTIKNLILPAIVGGRYSYPVVLEFAGHDIAADEELQRKILETRSRIRDCTGIDVVFVFLEMPRLMAPVKKMLIRIVLECYFRLKDAETLLSRILEHSGDRNIVDDKILVLAAEKADVRAVNLLLYYRAGLSMADEPYLKAAAGHGGRGKEVIEILLDKYGAATAITPNVFRIVADRYPGLFEYLLETRLEQVPITAEIIGQIRDEKVLRLVLWHKRDKLAQIASQALRKAVKGLPYLPYRENTLQPLLECCPLSWFEPSEALMLDALETGSRQQMMGQISLLIHKFGDKIVITESILAAAASTADAQVPDIFKNWKPEQFKVTPLVVAKTAACGSPYGLDYLEEWADGTLDFNMADAYGKTALHVAAHEGTLPLVRFLLEEARADVLATDRRGWTALHFAVCRRRGNTEIVQTLLAEGANPYQAALEGETPVSIVMDRLEIAPEYAYKCAKKLLRILKAERDTRFLDDEDDEEQE
ncbi:hypothetical protein NLG97_g5654 [Lecanicillium saksenae]|uniref:Uncharacterized protein n=1 Tax=Lecanicillium saksenae TaxID=468837 RepID=A0ACC1QUE6_9HYPO|nr:hypothetical protein NLG97_g5654 [Lecanicillium saksenae]